MSQKLTFQKRATKITLPRKQPEVGIVIRYALLSLLLATPAIGQTQTVPAPTATPAAAPGTKPATRTMRIKFPADNLARIPIKRVMGLILMPAQIGGQQVNVLFDNGSQATIIDEQVAIRSGMAITKNVSLLSAGTATLPLGMAEGSMVLGGSLTLDGQMMVADLGKISQRLGTPIAAVMGADAMSAMVLVINPERSWLAASLPGHINVSASATVGDGTTRPDMQAITAMAPKMVPAFIPFDENQTVKATINGKPARLMIDYGFSAAIQLRDDLWQQAIPPEDRSGETHTLAMGAGNLIEARQGMAREVTIEAIQAKDVPVNSVQARDMNGGEGRLGIGMLGSTVTVLNMPRKQLIIFPAKQEIDVSATNPAPTGTQTPPPPPG